DHNATVGKGSLFGEGMRLVIPTSLNESWEDIFPTGVCFGAHVVRFRRTVKEGTSLHSSCHQGLHRLIPGTPTPAVRSKLFSHPHHKLSLYCPSVRALRKHLIRHCLSPPLRSGDALIHLVQQGLEHLAVPGGEPGTIVALDDGIADGPCACMTIAGIRLH